MRAPTRYRGRTATLDEAKANVLDAFTRFTNAFVDLARDFFENRWIEAAIRAAKP
jgi:oligoendopeptidase F